MNLVARALVCLLLLIFTFCFLVMYCCYHSRGKPITIFMDQDHAIAKAVFEIMPIVGHGLYTFHLMQNALKYI